MKLKIFIFAIFAILSLVAYQKYSEYTVLKFIDSYDSCVIAKGSIIQESYPATCITKIGDPFIQHSINKQNLSQAESDITWKKYSNTQLNFSIEYPSSWILTMSEDRQVGWSTIISNRAKSEDVTQSIMIDIEYSNIFEIPFSGGEKIVITKHNLGEYAYLGNTPSTSVFENRPAIKSVNVSPYYGAHTALRMLDGNRLITIKIDTKDETALSLHDQILSTFKFTD